MFESIINRAQHSVESVVTKYALRAAVTVPFLIAFGFGTAAATVKLVQMYGHTQAYSIIAAAFAVIGLIAAASIAATSPRSATAAAVETQEAVGSESGAEKSVFDSDLLVTTLGIVGPKAIPAIPLLLRFAVRNWALVVALIGVAYLLMSEKQSPTTEVAQP